MAAFMKALSSLVTNFSRSLPRDLYSLNRPFLQCCLPFQLTANERFMSRYKRRKTHAPIWWISRRRKFISEYLTEENKNFLDGLAKDAMTAQAEGSPLKEAPWHMGEWGPKTVRCGVIARKIGIYPMWNKNGEKMYTTLLQV